MLCVNDTVGNVFKNEIKVARQDTPGLAQSSNIFMIHEVTNF